MTSTSFFYRRTPLPPYRTDWDMLRCSTFRADCCTFNGAVVSQKRGLQVLAAEFATAVAVESSTADMAKIEGVEAATHAREEAESHLEVLERKLRRKRLLLAACPHTDIDAIEMQVCFCLGLDF